MLINSGEFSDVLSSPKHKINSPYDLDPSIPCRKTQMWECVSVFVSIFSETQNTAVFSLKFVAILDILTEFCGKTGIRLGFFVDILDLV